MPLRPIGLLLATALSGAALGLAGCNEPAAEPHLLAEPSALQVTKTTDTHVVPVDGDGRVSPAELRRVDEFIAALADKRPESVRVRLDGASESLLRTLAARIERDGIAHDHITILAVAPSSGGRSVPGVNVVVDHYTVALPHCPPPVDGPLGNSNTTSPDLGCSNLDNLAVMVADPSDLTQGNTRQNAEGPPAVSALRRYEEDKVPPLPKEGEVLSLPAGSAGGGGQ